MKFQRTLSQPYVILHGDVEPSPADQPRSGGIWQRFANVFSLDTLCSSLLKFATGAEGPMVRERCDRNGEISYTIYDPVTQQQSDWLSEMEARTWLEQRYYQ